MNKIWVLGSVCAVSLGLSDIAMAVQRAPDAFIISPTAASPIQPAEMITTYISASTTITVQPHPTWLELIEGHTQDGMAVLTRPIHDAYGNLLIALGATVFLKYSATQNGLEIEIDAIDIGSRKVDLETSSVSIGGSPIKRNEAYQNQLENNAQIYNWVSPFLPLVMEDQQWAMVGSALLSLIPNLINPPSPEIAYVSEVLPIEKTFTTKHATIISFSRNGVPVQSAIYIPEEQEVTYRATNENAVESLPVRHWARQGHQTQGPTESLPLVEKRAGSSQHPLTSDSVDSEQSEEKLPYVMQVRRERLLRP